MLTISVHNNTTLIVLHETNIFSVIDIPLYGESYQITCEKIYIS